AIAKCRSVTGTGDFRHANFPGKALAIDRKISRSMSAAINDPHVYRIGPFRQKTRDRQSVSTIISRSANNTDPSARIDPQREPLDEGTRRTLHQVDGSYGFVLNRVSI